MNSEILRVMWCFNRGFDQQIYFFKGIGCRNNFDFAKFWRISNFCGSQINPQYQMSEQHRSPNSTPSRTPVASRPYLSMGQTYHTPHNNSPSNSHHPNETHSVASERRGGIYGTTIDIHDTETAIERFVMEYEVFQEIDGKSIPHRKYLDDLKALQTDDLLNTLDVQASHIKEFNRQMYYRFILYPAEMISLFDNVLRSMYQRIFVEPQNDPVEMDKKKMKAQTLQVTIYGLEDKTALHSLSAKHINRLIYFEGIVIRCSDIYPEMKIALFRCSGCKSDTLVYLENAIVDEPKQCQRCRSKNQMEIQHNLCTFTDKQEIKFQQLPELTPEGETPQTISIICYDSNVDRMRPGDRVKIVGIYRAQGKKILQNRRTLRSVFDTYMDLISVEPILINKFQNTSETDKATFDDDQKRRFFEMASDPHVIDKLAQSFAPSIYGHEDVKKGILCQLFSGCQKKFSQSGRGRFRSDINICLVGDPSTSKSQMLQQVYKIAPRGIYTSGKGSSAVGLTANVRKDPETGEYILESGALVLSDKGICCIDEFDKMDENSRTILLEAMEQQTISVAKAGIVCSLNSRASILAAANPVNSKYNPRLTVVENINLSPALLSRFDLIYLMLDQASESYDTRLAHHILAIFGKKSNVVSKAPYSREQLTNYISFARQEYFPQLTEQSCKILNKAYVELRAKGSQRKIVTATTRQLESMIRVSEAFAKMRLSTTVQKEDVDRAVSLIIDALQQSATDPKTGLIDLDMIVTGKTNYMRSRIERIGKMIREHIEANLAKYKKGMIFDVVLGEIAQLITIDKEYKDKVTDQELKEALVMLESEGVVSLYGANKNKPSIKVSKDFGLSR